MKGQKRKANNHFISEFQLRQFLCEPPKNKPGKYFVWEYSRNASASPQNIKHVASAEYFFGKDDDILEDKFADLESRYGNIYKTLVGDPARAAEFSGDLSALCFLFSFRTQALRERMRNSISSLLDELSSSTQDERHKRYFDLQVELQLKSIVEEFFAAVPVSQREMIEKNPEFQKKIALATTKIREQIESGETGALMRQALSLMKKDLAVTDRLDNSHNGQLMKFISLGQPVPESRKLSFWTHVESPRSQFVLGDCGAFTVSPEGKVAPFLGDNDWREVYIPLSPKISLVGSREPVRPLLKPEEITISAMRTSHKNVFSDKYRKDLEAVAKEQIGTFQGLVEQNVFGEAISSIWNES